MSAAGLSKKTKFGDRTLADIAAMLPGATVVFRRHKLDFCCNGRVALAEAAASKGLSVRELDEELEAVAAFNAPAERPHASGELIDVIQRRYHAAHRRELPELIRLARRVESAHRDHPEVPRGLADLLLSMSIRLEDNMRKEEQVLFPLMRRGGHPMMAHPIAAILAEHDSQGAWLRELERITSDFTPPEDACPTWEALYVGVWKLTDDLTQHIHTENNLLFPQFIN